MEICCFSLEILLRERKIQKERDKERGREKIEGNREKEGRKEWGRRRKERKGEGGGKERRRKKRALNLVCHEINSLGLSLRIRLSSRCLQILPLVADACAPALGFTGLPHIFLLLFTWVQLLRYPHTVSEIWKDDCKWVGRIHWLISFPPRETHQWTAVPPSFGISTFSPRLSLPSRCPLVCNGHTSSPSHLFMACLLRTTLSSDIFDETLIFLNSSPNY